MQAECKGVRRREAGCGVGHAPHSGCGTHPSSHRGGQGITWTDGRSAATGSITKSGEVDLNLTYPRFTAETGRWF